MSVKAYKILIVMFSLTISIAANADQGISDKNSALINQTILSFMNKNHIPGAAVEIYDNAVPHAYYYGYADVKNKIPVTQHTIFEIGSISKIFTSLLIAEEVNAHHMSLNSPFTQYLPDFAAGSNSDLNKITIEELATHTSGLPFNVPRSTTTRSALVQFCADWEPSAPIGSQWIYSNMGMGLLGYSLEGVTHQNFNQLYRANILKPLNMEQIALTVPKRLQQYYAKGYDMNGQVVKPINMVLFPTAGAMKVSGKDIQQFLKAAIGLPGTPIKINSAMRLTETPFVAASNMKQGLGWEIRDIHPQQIDSLLINPLGVGAIPAKQLSANEQRYDANTLIEKTGTTDGFRAYIAVIPAQRSGIVILTNHFSADDQIVSTGRNILFNLASH